MPPENEMTDVELIRTWTLPPAATMGSAVRAKGILQEIQARLTANWKKAISLEGNEITLAMPAIAKAAFNAAASVVAKAMKEAETFPVIPREIQDILSIKNSERHRWLADGRLPSAGTRTVRLNGRARQITFHVFDPKIVEDLLDRGIVYEWRVEDAEARTERRRKAAYHAKLTASLNKQRKSGGTSDPGLHDEATELRRWQNFDHDGFLWQKP